MSSPTPTATPYPPFPPTLTRQIRAATKVPMPVERHPTWTINRSHTDIPATFSNLIVLPNALVTPAYFAAAIDTIKITNDYFQAAGPYSNTLKQDHVRDLAGMWRQGYQDEEKYPYPADIRSLYVKALKSDGTLVSPNDDVGEEVERVWVKACRQVAAMSALEKSAYLRMTRAQHVFEQAKEPLTYGGGVNDGMVVRLFKRFLVWREHEAGREGRKDVQPSREELEAFFEARKEGASLADICHFFPDAGDIKMLVHRVETIAVLMPVVENGEMQESVYRHKTTLETRAERKRTEEREEFEDAVEEQTLVQQRSVDQRTLSPGTKRKHVEVEEEQEEGAVEQQQPSVDQTAPVVPPHVTAATQRPAAVDHQPPTKKQRKEVSGEPLRLFKCNGRTKKNRACQLKRRLPPSSTHWNCGRH
ncbi:hypothetical protein GQ44DRAFT_772479 [Phaeosphaeriaceae sp. PMI808]|nr:hypothetical protein GQ44DRAFT_772479 [Phaeosphaeriaceae sp. PMI808]